ARIVGPGLDISKSRLSQVDFSADARPSDLHRLSASETELSASPTTPTATWARTSTPCSQMHPARPDSTPLTQPTVSSKHGALPMPTMTSPHCWPTDPLTTDSTPDPVHRGGPDPAWIPGRVDWFDT
ncbi:hypothetical protein, partial [Nocardia salmonicida]|uniref:hypothetical protein n=1 Tax=Nocardia salmonicida TaxID=53431 RepID=UPI00365207C1